MKQQRIFLTRDEALSLCAFSDDDTIHTFRQGGFGFIGCDFSKKNLLEKWMKQNSWKLLVHICVR